jgi:predicted nucleotidyltransferase
MNEYDYLVLLTLIYSSCFSFALTTDEITNRLPKAPKKIFFSKQKIKQSLKKLLDQSLIQSDGQYFYLKEKDLLNRKKRAQFIAEKQIRAKEFVELAKKVPFVKAIILTGSTAVDNAKKEDDLDFMIICQKNTLWISRFILIILTKLKDKRPSREKDNAWCLNLWLDEFDLTIDENRRSLYEAYEILQMKFIFDRDDCQKKFLNANDWLKKYLLFYDNFKFEKYNGEMSFSAINQLMFWMQKKYRLTIFGQENFDLTPTQAFFNHLNFREKLFIKLRKKLKQYL